MRHALAKSVKSFDDVTIYYEILGHSRAKKYLVFLHGLGGDLTAWNTERKALHDLGYASIAIDLRGHGLSDRPNKEKDYEIENFVKDIVVVLKKENVKEAIIVGHCFGGIVTLSLAGTHPHIAKAIILIDTGYKPPYFSKTLAEFSFIKKVFDLITTYSPMIYDKEHVDFSKFKGTSDYNLRRILSDVLHTSIRTYLLISQRLTKLNAKQLLERITVPCLIIEGLKDSIYPPEVAIELNNRIHNSELLFIPKGNHIVVLSNPKDIVRDIYRFLKKIHL